MDRQVSPVIVCTVHEEGWFSDRTRYSLPHHRVQSKSEPHPASYPTSNGHVSPRVKRPGSQTTAEIKNPWNLSTRPTLPLTCIKKNNSLKVLSDHLKSGWLWGGQSALTWKINQKCRKGYIQPSEEFPNLNMIKPTKLLCSNGWELLVRSVNRF